MEGPTGNQQQQVILRLPELLALRVSNLLDGSGSDDILDINLIPQNDENKFTFILGNDSFPALLMNLPTIIETQKTFDRKTFTKSGEVSQVLHVFLSDIELDNVNSKLCKSLHDNYYPHGLTFPAFDIVRGRFDKTSKMAMASSRFSPYQVRSVIEEINGQWEYDEAEENETKEWKYEEVVDFENWMATPDDPYGISLNFDACSPSNLALIMEHPEVLVTFGDLDDDRLQEEYERLQLEATVDAAALSLSKNELDTKQAVISSYKNSSYSANEVNAPSVTLENMSILKEEASSVDGGGEEEEEGGDEDDDAWMLDV